MNNYHTKKKKKTGRKTSELIPPRSMYDILNGFFERYERIFFGLSMLLSVLMCIFMFDVMVSQSGDDSDYLIAADDFWRHFTFPGAHGGPLYTILLSPVVGLLGMKLILLKSFSGIFILLSLWLFYKSLRKKVPAAVLMPALLLTSICSYLFFYAAYTYSEPFFMLIQGLFFYFFSKYFLREENVSYSLKKDWRKYLIVAGLALGMSLTRSVGYGVLGAVILFLAIRLRWKDLLCMMGACALVFVSFSVLKSFLWPGSGGIYGLAGILARDAYNPALGTEDFAGLVRRFIENSHVYLSSCLSQFLGITEERPSHYINIAPARTILLYMLYAISLVAVFRRNKALLFTGLYAGVMTFGTFLAIQASWAQDRLIVIYYPFILLFLLGGICYLFQIGILRKGFLIYPVAVIIVAWGTLSITQNRIKRNLPVLQQNLTGDMLYGWTPDWQNYIRGLQWADQHLEKDAVILSRKPSISYVYTGRKFVATYPPIASADELETLPREAQTPVVTTTVLAPPLKKLLRYIVSVQNGHFTIDGSQTNSVFIYTIPNEEPDQSLQQLKDGQVKYTLDYSAFLEQCKTLDNIRVYDPDKMYQCLEDAGVDYILLPQLRMDPVKKTGFFINNIHRYVWFISYKYPERFLLIHTVGRPDNEPCEIVKFIR